MAKYIVSTMTNAVCYRVYRTIGEVNPSKGPRIVAPIMAEDIMIRGGANRPSQKSGFGESTQDVNGNVLWTAEGSVTSITDEQFGRLEKHWLFQKHLVAGKVAIIGKDISSDHNAVKKVVATMNKKDAHAQLTPKTAPDRIKVRTPEKSLAQEW